MNLKEFEKAIIADEITNFEPYFKEGTPSEIYNRKEICIKHNVAQEFYPEWASITNPNHSEGLIQYRLAKQGHCLDILSKSKDATICRAVLQNNINYALDPDIIKQHLEQISFVIMRTANIPINVLNDCIKIFNTRFNPPYKDNLPALELKLKAITHTPTTIEKTMTSVQLYLAHNPLWTLNLTGNQIGQVINSTAGVHELKKILERSHHVSKTK